MSRASLVALVLAGTVAAAAVPAQVGAAVSRKPQKKTFTVNDNYFGPVKSPDAPAPKVTVNRGSTISWVWPDSTADVHDLTLIAGPKGVKQFASGESAAGFLFRRKLSVPGVYKFICALHEADGMKMQITVRK